MEGDDLGVLCSLAAGVNGGFISLTVEGCLFHGRLNLVGFCLLIELSIVS